MGSSSSSTSTSGAGTGGTEGATLAPKLLLSGLSQKNGTVTLKLRCYQSACAGAATETARVRTGHGKHARTKTESVAHSAFSISLKAPSDNLAVSLNATGRRLLKAAHRLKVTVTLTLNGKTVTSRTVTLASTGSQRTRR